MFQIFQNFIAEWKTIYCMEHFRDTIMLVRRLFKSISVYFSKEMFDHKVIYSLSVKFCIKKNKPNVATHKGCPQTYGTFWPLVSSILVDLPSLSPHVDTDTNNSKKYCFHSHTSTSQSPFSKQHRYFLW